MSLLAKVLLQTFTKLRHNFYNLQKYLPRKGTPWSLNLCWSQLSVTTIASNVNGSMKILIYSNNINQSTLAVHPCTDILTFLVPAGHMLGQSIVETKSLITKRTQPLVTVANYWCWTSWTICRCSSTLQQDVDVK